MGNIITGGTLPQVTVRGKGKPLSSLEDLIYIIPKGYDIKYDIDEDGKRFGYITPKDPWYFKFDPKTGLYPFSPDNEAGREMLLERSLYPYGDARGKGIVILDANSSSEYNKNYKGYNEMMNKPIVNNLSKRKYQEGGLLSTTLQQGLQYLAQMYAQQTGKDPQSDQEGFMQFVQQLAQQAGVQDIGQLLDMIYQLAQGQAQAAKRGAKLNYLKKLSDKCPEGTELRYFASGGQVCSKCVSVQKEKCGSKMKKKKACGGAKMKFQPGGPFSRISNLVNKVRDINSITDHSQSLTASNAIRNGVIRRNWIDGTIEYLPHYPALDRSLAGQQSLQRYFNAPQSEVMYSTPEMLPEVIVTGKKTK